MEFYVVQTLTCPFPARYLIYMIPYLSNALWPLYILQLTSYLHSFSDPLAQFTVVFIHHLHPQVFLSS